VEFATWRGLEPSGWDWALLFNVALLPATALAAEECRRREVPYVLFPVFWDLPASIPKEQREAVSRLLPADSARRRAVSRAGFALREMNFTEVRSGARLLTAGNRRLVGQVVEGASVVCPNSEAEASHLAHYLGVRRDERWVVVRNGIWGDEVPTGMAWPDRAAEVLCLGGLSPRKNSLLLVEAARAAGIPLRMVGQAGRLNGYARRVVAAAGATTVIEGFRPRAEVLKLLGSVRAHAQVGFVETPGLATLEAVAAGSSAVVSNNPVVEEYLPGGVWRVDPRSVASIASGLESAVTTRPPPDLASMVCAAYDWSVVLRPLVSVLGPR
jgi:glycosyltransferase involved in cell wall biosynthesis